MKLKDLERWQLKRLLCGVLAVLIIGGIYIAFTASTLYQDKMAEDDYWNNAFVSSEEVKSEVERLSKDATAVSCGTYIENLKEVSLKNSNFRLEMMVWFNWDGDQELDMANNFRIYKGLINKREVVKETFENGHCYQLVRIDVTVTKNYWTKRFPLESHQLKIYIEPNYNVNKVVLTADKKDSGYNGNLSIAGFDMVRVDTGTFDMKYGSTQGDPDFKDAAYTTEHVTQMEINRSNGGLYAKCFIALIGTITWVMIILFICTYHRVDPLSMIPAALFGTVANIMVGANLVPDALDMGLLEYVNIFNIMIILMTAISVININRIRNKFEDRDFAKLFGRSMFAAILLLVLVGNLTLPLCAYIF